MLLLSAAVRYRDCDRFCTSNVLLLLLFLIMNLLIRMMRMRISFVSVMLAAAAIRDNIFDEATMDDTEDG